MKDKIEALHLQRCAAVYLRQSSLKQLVEHRESTTRQYALRQRAMALGWPPERVNVIDCDLGLSGSSAENRSGFQQLAEDVAEGKIGAIFALEVSRLARSSADWHRLLELCGLADVVIVDEQAVYAPKEYDDRLLLGLKGTMSEAEQYWMRLRLQGGALNKARRGEYRINPPIGYDWDAGTTRLVQTPDEQVRKAIALVFERFRLGDSARGIVRHFADLGLEFPARAVPYGELRWGPPIHAHILDILRNPLYTGAYVYGRRLERKAIINGRLCQRHVTWLEPQDWKVCIRDRHSSYIEWDEYMANQKKLEANRNNHRIPEQRGAARRGEALLQGLVLCGRCGHRMRTCYKGQKRFIGYRCREFPGTYAPSGECCSMTARGVDRAVVERFLQAAAPDELDLSLAVAAEVERQTQDVARQWELRLERMRYEARHAERRYKAVDPDNRVVARTLEKEWNDKLCQVEQLETQMQQALQEKHLQMTDADRKRILELARDLPRVWRAPSTTHEDRKHLLRLAIEEITLTPVEVPSRGIRVQILWRSGAVEDLMVDRDWRGGKRTATSQASVIAEVQILLERVRSLMAQGLTDPEMTAVLNQEQTYPRSGRPWTRKALQRFRGRNGLRSLITSGVSQKQATSRRGVPARKGVL